MKYWTDEETNEMLSLHESGKTIKEISEELDRSEQAVDNRLKLKRLENEEVIVKRYQIIVLGDSSSEDVKMKKFVRHCIYKESIIEVHEYNKRDKHTPFLFPLKKEGDTFRPIPSKLEFHSICKEEGIQSTVTKLLKDLKSALEKKVRYQRSHLEKLEQKVVEVQKLINNKS